MRLHALRRSLRAKLVIFLLLAITLPLTASIIITNMRTSSIVTEDKVKTAANLLYQGKTNLEHYMTTVTQASLLVYNGTSGGDTLYRILEQGREDYLSEQEIYTSLQNIAIAVKEVHQVYLHAAKAGRGYVIVGGNKKKMDQTQPSNGNFLEHVSVAPVFEPTHKSGDYGILLPPYSVSKRVVSIHRKIIAIPSDVQIGTLSIDINTSIIDAICQQLYDNEKEQLYLLSKDGTVVYGPTSAEIGLSWQDTEGRALLQTIKGSGSLISRSDTFHGVYVYDQLELNGLDWTLVKLIPNSTLQAGTRQVTMVNTVVLTISAIIVAIVAVLISFWITSPIRKLTEYANRIQSGELDIDIRLNRTDEIGALARRFRLMMETINNLVLREYRLEIANKTNELKALQAQVQPHFLYNALQMIGTSALQSGAPGVYQLVMLLGKLMRYSMSGSNKPVALAQEIEHTTAYLELQQQRFGDKLQYEIDMAPETGMLPVPRMILQPLAENVFKHAFDPAGGVMRVTVQTKRRDEQLLISVENDGPSIPASRLDELRSLIDQQSERSDQEHIGLSNVLSRLRLNCGEDASMTLDGGMNGGLRVTLHVPIGQDSDEEAQL
ncbi:sensor histidine kinase [Paenibacillus sp. PR3]|uniref:Sensor histidine kinase n=1 Tax=Paenibacillus terricola TaxID=2763503 RepID=A0ABR8MNE4_9BACL|nr:sensor histidine kinase [Paenibacillus terricola]MBD3917540.1 sensor histidine kinase [Paenibacillus terricola]